MREIERDARGIRVRRLDPHVKRRLCRASDVVHPRNGCGELGTLPDAIARKCNWTFILLSRMQLARRFEEKNNVYFLARLIIDTCYAQIYLFILIKID